jgi:MFS family permease
MVNKSGRIYYGWIALIGSMLTALVAGGAFIYSYGVFLPVMCEEFGWSRAVVSVGLSIGLLTFGLPSPLAGILVARFGPRVNMIWGNAVAALGLAGMYLVTEVWHVYALYCIAGLGAGIGGYVAGSTIANNWFTRKRSLAIGLFTSGAGLGGFVFPPVATVLIEAVGWRMSWLALAGIILVGAVIIASGIIVRNRPEDMGLLPDGDMVNMSEGLGIIEKEAEATEEPRWQIREAVKLLTTWLVGIFAAANYVALGTMVAHQVAHVRDLGYSPVTAALTMSIVSGVGIVGRLGCGAAALRINIRYLAIAGVILQLIALSILMTFTEISMVYVYAILFGLSNGMLITAMPTIIGEYYGRASFALLMGVMLAVGIALESLAPVIAGIIYDSRGTYLPAFAGVAGFSLIGLISYIFSRKPGLPR